MKVDCLLHVHSSFSYDSKTDLADIARIARAQGIGCVLMSEHNNTMDAQQMASFVARCEDLSDERLLIIPGLELSFDHNCVHLLAFGISEYIDSFAEGCTFRSLVDAVHQADGLAVLAHPSHRSGVARLQARDLEVLDGIEIWNVKSGNRFLPTHADMSTLSSVRATKRASLAFAGLDWHHLNRFSRLILRVDTSALTRDAVLRSLKGGSYSIRNGLVSVPAAQSLRGGRWRLYGLVSHGLAEARKTAYRWQAALESRGVTTPAFVRALARRFF